jgi:3-hydroxyisobutyrate dehydrogenase-like beta-hydroxyacid dehydrogenase
MKPLRWGILGFGEVGATFARQLLRSSAQVVVCDPLLNQMPRPAHIEQRLAGLPVQIAADAAAVADGADVVCSLVTAGSAAGAATAAATKARGVLFLDFNSISPRQKQRLAALFEPGAYVDGAILGAIAGSGARTPLAVAGPRAAAADAALLAAGFTSSVIGATVGAASALKLCRSIFMKGLECLFVETLLAAGSFGILDAVLDTVEETYTSYGFHPLMEMLVTTHAAHCGRRAEEMRGVEAMLQEMNLPASMSAAAAVTLQHSYDAGLRDRFAGQAPGSYADVVDYLRRTHDSAQAALGPPL